MAILSSKAAGPTRGAEAEMNQELCYTPLLQFSHTSHFVHREPEKLAPSSKKTAREFSVLVFTFQPGMAQFTCAMDHFFNASPPGQTGVTGGSRQRILEKAIIHTVGELASLWLLSEHSLRRAGQRIIWPFELVRKRSYSVPQNSQFLFSEDAL